MRRTSLLWTVVFMATIVMASPPVYGQGGGTTTSLSGLVLDSSGAVIPGADVVIKNNATTAESRTVTDSTGRFTVPALNPGTYTVRVSLMGFKTFVAPDVTVVAATPASIRAVLEVGALEETVVVTGSTEIVQTQSAAVQTTIAVKQIEALPLVTRTALDYVVMLPGVQTAGTNSRGSTINGLPSVTINITLDGVNVQDNNNRNGDGFFMYIRPLMDSVEEITVSTSTPGAESAGQGASQIRMVTRSGGNRFTGSAYNTWRNQAGTNDADVMARTKKGSWIWGLNTPYWFNKRDVPKTKAGEYFIDDVRLQTPGFRVGGPVKKDKLFYFFNWEWFLWPNQVSRVRYLVNPNAQTGLFTYKRVDNGQNQTVNLYTIATGNSQVSTADPVVAKLLADIRAAALTMGGTEAYDSNVDKYTYSPGGMQKRHFPTGRLDYNITQAHRLTFTSRYNRFASDPDILNGVEPIWPDFPNYAGQYSDRFMAQGTLRSTFGKNVVNEARIGYSGGFGGGTQFFPELSEAQFNCDKPGCQRLNSPQNYLAGGPIGPTGWNIGIGNAASGITTATASTGPSKRYTPTYVYEDTLSWLKGRHTVSAGASWTRILTKNWNDTVVNSVTLGMSTLDPAYNMLHYVNGAANFPGGITSTESGYARNLYAVLTGRVTNIGGTAYLDQNGKYQFLGDRWNLTSMNELGIFVQDSWRVKPNLTLTGGVRYELQFPFQADGSSYARLQDWRMVYGVTGEGNLFKLNAPLTGQAPVLENYPKGDKGWDMDMNNIAPSVGAAWRPTLKGSSFFERAFIGPLLSYIIGPDPVLRGGYSLSYSRYATQDFINIYGSNPGQSRTASRSETTGTPVIGGDGQGWPLLLRQPDRLYASSFPAAPAYPFAPAVNESVYANVPNLKVPYTHQWSAGWQRELGKSMALEIQYIGNQNVGDWTTWGMNSSANQKFLENGWLEEFQKARANLHANILAGRGTSFAYFGPGTGTSPLPIYMAYYKGIPLADGRNQDPAQYVGVRHPSYPTVNVTDMFNNSNTYGSLSMFGPSLTTPAGTGTYGFQNGIGTGAGFDANRIAAGLPINFFMANPAVAQANGNLTMNGGNTRYNAMQFNLRRRMSAGFLVQGSYVMTFGRKTWTWYSLRSDWEYIDSGGNPVHAIKAGWVYELPFGQGKQFGSGASRWKDMLIGGWEVDGQVRLQSGQRYNFGGYRLVGMSAKDLQKMFKLRTEIDAAGKERIYMFPKDVIENSLLALNTTSSSSATGYSGTLPTGRYLAPTNTLECIQYTPKGYCPGTSATLFITGPWFGKLDMSFVKRITARKNMRIEARMDLYNILDSNNFFPRYDSGSTLSGWEINSAARDLNASQDAGGRITSFGLRFSW